MTMLGDIERLRWKAIEEAVNASPDRATIHALDAAVEAAGGKCLFHTQVHRSAAGLLSTVRSQQHVSYGGGEGEPIRVPQGDASARVLKEHGPLPVGRLMEKVADYGVTFRGEKPLVSFRSMLSKDARFRSIPRNGMYFWWLNGVDLPEGWEGTAEPDLLDQSAAPSDNQEGGDADAAIMT